MNMTRCGKQALVGLTLALSGAACAGDAPAPLYAVAGVVTDQTEGWSFKPSDNSGFNPSEGYYPDKGGRLFGPTIPAAPNSFYELRFTLRARERVYWGLDFFDAENVRRLADNYGSHLGYGWQTLVRVAYTENDAHGLQPFFQSRGGVEVRDFSVTPATPERAREILAALQDEMPALDFKAPDISAQLPKTFAALKDGRPWKVVMLGDSIINDTFNSCFMANIREAWPQADWRVVCSVRGGTGCQFYREPENFKQFVTAYQPDLLIIGGISNGNPDVAKAIENYASVVEQAKAAFPDVEILLLSGPMGPDWRKWSQNNPHAGLDAMEPPEQAEIYQRLTDYARENNLAFGDMERAWATYLGASRVPYMFYYRDWVHANEHSKMILGKIFAELFAPKS